MRSLSFRTHPEHFSAWFWTLPSYRLAREAYEVLLKRLPAHGAQEEWSLLLGILYGRGLLMLFTVPDLFNSRVAETRTLVEHMGGEELLGQIKEAILPHATSGSGVRVFAL